MKDGYKDIINLPRHISRNRPKMVVKDRAAQFAPFAALRGHSETVEETARVREERPVLDHYIKEEIDYKLQILKENIKEGPRVRISYFKPDKDKELGSYIYIEGSITRIDQYKKNIFLSDGSIIPIDHITNIDGAIY